MNEALLHPHNMRNILKPYVWLKVGEHIEAVTNEWKKKVADSKEVTPSQESPPRLALTPFLHRP